MQPQVLLQQEHKPMTDLQVDADFNYHLCKTRECSTGMRCTPGGTALVSSGLPLQVVFALAVSIFFLCLQYKFRPYQEDAENMLDRQCKMWLLYSCMASCL